MKKLKISSDLESGDKGKYTTKEALHRENKIKSFKARWYGFEFICHHNGKAIIKTEKGHLHEKGDDFYFSINDGGQ